MDSGDEERDVHVEINRTLISINDTFQEIRRELKAVADLVNTNGELRSTLLRGIRKLSQEAEDMGIDTNDIASPDQDLLKASTNPMNVIEELLSSSMNQ